jgi:hypothetical protein
MVSTTYCLLVPVGISFFTQIFRISKVFDVVLGLINFRLEQLLAVLPAQKVLYTITILVAMTQEWRRLDKLLYTHLLSPSLIFFPPSDSEQQGEMPIQ